MVPDRRLTFLRDSSIWNEINTFTCVRLFRENRSAAQAVREFGAWKWLDPSKGDALLPLLRQSDEVIKELLYIDEIGRLRMFFRRLRLPPLLSVFWDHILVGQPMRQVLACFVQDGDRLIAQGRAALAKLDAMIAQTEALGLAPEDLRFQRDTFEILVAAREFYFGPAGTDIEDRLIRMRDAYRRRYRQRYSIHLDFRRIRFQRHHVKLLVRLLFRDQRDYRVVDRMILLRMLSFFHLVLRLVPHPRVLPEFADKTAMGVDVVFK